MAVTRIIICGCNAAISPFAFRALSGYAEASAAHCLRHLNGATAHPSSFLSSVQTSEAAGSLSYQPAADLLSQEDDE